MVLGLNNLFPIIVALIGILVFVLMVLFRFTDFTDQDASVFSYNNILLSLPVILVFIYFLIKESFFDKENEENEKEKRGQT